MHNFYALGMDYAWGHNSIGVFKDEVKKAKKKFVGAVFSPIGTKDFSTYITKIRQSGADACFLVLQGDDNNAFLSQAHEYRLPDKVQLAHLDRRSEFSIHAVGDAALGLAGSTRYVFTIDNPANKAFVVAWQKEYKALPDVFEGEQFQACQMLQAGIEAAKSIDAEKLRAGAGDGGDRQHQGPCRDARLRPPGGAGRLHGEGGASRQGSKHAGAGDHRHVSGRSRSRRPADR